MKMNKIIINSQFAHFKIPYGSKVQCTYKIPPISTVIGILKNIYGNEIDNFVFGYTLENNGVFIDIQKIYKEVNLNAMPSNKRFNDSGAWVSDVCSIEYLFEPKLIIYSNIENDTVMNDCMNLGKTDCLATIKSIESIELVDKIGQGYSQWTDINVGYGVIYNITTETEYNIKRGIYNYYTKKLRLNDNFEYDKFYDEEENQNIYLWEYNKSREDKIKCYVESK